MKKKKKNNREGGVEFEGGGLVVNATQDSSAKFEEASIVDDPVLAGKETHLVFYSSVNRYGMTDATSIYKPAAAVYTSYLRHRFSGNEGLVVTPCPINCRITRNEIQAVVSEVIRSAENLKTVTFIGYGSKDSYCFGDNIDTIEGTEAQVMKALKYSSNLEQVNILCPLCANEKGSFAEAFYNYLSDEMVGIVVTSFWSDTDKGEAFTPNMKYFTDEGVFFWGRQNRTEADTKERQLNKTCNQWDGMAELVRGSEKVLPHWMDLPFAMLPASLLVRYMD